MPTAPTSSPLYETLTGERYKELLKDYNPLLVLLPTRRNRVRPGAIWADPAWGRGDYHPCTARFFLNQVVQYDGDERPGKSCGKRTIEEIYDKIAANPHRPTHEWEIDVTWIPRRLFGFFSAPKAWEEYSAMADPTPQGGGSPASRFDPEAAECVTYARVIATSKRMLLQYFYLYIYNDSANKHEGDWEMCAVELDRTTMKPQLMAFSGHQSGLKRAWPGITRRGKRPVVFVARGSHASYPEHVPGGIHVAEANWHKNLPGLLKDIVAGMEKVVSNMFFFCGIRDFTSVLTYAGRDDPLGTTDPTVVQLPATPPAPGDADWCGFWWMRIDCPWGSHRGGVTQFIAPSPAWIQEPKWTNPFCWIDKLPNL